MNELPDMNDVKLALSREVYRDGLTEIVTGTLFFIVALATGRPQFYWTYLFAIFLLGPGLERIRAKTTYPRIGYAKLPKDNPRRLRGGILTWVMGVFLLAAVILAVTGHLTDNQAWRRLAPAIAGFLFAGGFAYLAGQSRFIRHRFLAGLSMISGVAMVVPPIDEPYGNFRVWALVMGLVCLVIGAWVLHRFVRDNPVVEERMPDE
jgi:uncharacterized membrane protein HdeD (DUF308 family)